MSEVTVNEELNKAVQAATNPADIREALLAEAQKQGLVRNESGAFVPPAADQAAADKVAAEKTAADKVAADAAAKIAEPTSEETPFKQTEVINGREFIFEAPTELELERMIANAYRVASAVKETTEEPKPAAVDPNQAALDKAAAEAEATAKTELELKFRRGEISASEYIEQSGAVKNYLEKQGLPLEALKASVEENANRKYEQSWADAVEEFKKGPGSDWPGGENNQEIMGLQIQALGLLEAEDKVAALAQVYEHMKSRDMVVPPKVSVSTDTSVADAAAAKAAADKVAADAVTAAAEKAKADAAAKAKAPSTSSSVFGASSGVYTQSTTPAAAAAAAASKVEIDPKASPEEILAAWKAGTVAAGKDPNAAFVEQFQSKR